MWHEAPHSGRRADVRTCVCGRSAAGFEYLPAVMTGEARIPRRAHETDCESHHDPAQRVPKRSAAYSDPVGSPAENGADRDANRRLRCGSFSSRWNALVRNSCQGEKKRKLQRRLLELFEPPRLAAVTGVQVDVEQQRIAIRLFRAQTRDELGRLEVLHLRVP